MLKEIRNAFKKVPSEENLRETFSLFKVQAFVENTLERLRRREYENSSAFAENKKAKEKTKYLIKISENCGKGDISAKLYMKRYISDLITNDYGVNESNIDYIYNFSSPKTVQDKFEIILHMYKEKFNYMALKELLKKYKLDEFRYFGDDTEEKCMVIDEDINNIFETESFCLSFEDKLEIVVQRVYQNTKGLGVVDEIRDMFCDGLSLGVSGVPSDFIGKLSDMSVRQGIDTTRYSLSYESIWLYMGKEIYLKFLKFDSQHELERICRLAYRFHDAPQLTRQQGYLFTYMADLSRIAVYRPPFTEGWCCFIRKFDVDPELDTLYSGENYEIVNEFLHYLGRTKCKVAITGPQGSGKTTLLIAIVRRMYSNITLRLWEDYFEAFLRLKLPDTNIMTIRKTKYIGGNKGIDAIKKSNGQVTIITEAAEDEHIYYIVKISLAASDAVLYTHHAVNEDALVSALKNGAINSGAFKDEETAENDVLNTLGFNPHLFIDPLGNRYIQRITEFITDEEETESKELLEDLNELNNTKDREKKMDAAFQLIARALVAKAIKKKHYRTSNIIEYDFEKNKYVVTAKISDKRKKEMMSKLLPQDKEKFKEFLIRMERMLEKEA